MKMFNITKYVDGKLIDDPSLSTSTLYMCDKTRTLVSYNYHKCIINHEALIELFHTSPYRTIKIITQSNNSYSYRFDEAFRWRDNVLESKFDTYIKEMLMELTEEEMFYLSLKEDYNDN